MTKNQQITKEDANRVAVLALFLVASFFSFGQERIDTIYYDKDWKGVSNSLFADFYRIAIYPDNELYKRQIRDYFITGELQATGGFISIDRYDDSKTIFDGELTTYFKNGNVASIRNYQNGKSNDEFCEYSEDGLIVRKGNFVDGRLSGLYTAFLGKDTYFQTEYIDGEPKYDYYVMGNFEGQIVKVKYSDNLPLWESPSVDERKIEYRNGTPWQYYIKNGLTIAQTNTPVRDYGKWHRIDLLISNNSMVPIEFDPALITAYSVDKKEKQIDLVVWSSEQYMGKVENAQAWAGLMVGLAGGLSAMNAGRSTSTTNYSAYYDGYSNSNGNVSVYGNNGYAYGSYSDNTSYNGSVYGTINTTTYDAAKAHQENVLTAKRMANFENAQWQERQAKNEGYLKKTTIYPGETITGYIHIGRESYITLHVTLNLCDVNYLFDWNYEKQIETPNKK